MLQGTIISDGNATVNNGYTAQENINVEPTCSPCGSIPEAENVEDFTAQFSQMFNAFADAIPQGTHEQKSAKGFFKKFSDYVGSKKFADDVNEKAEKYKVPPKQIAKNFFLKVLGIIGDILGIVVNTVCSIVDTAVTLLATLLHGAVAVIGKVGNAVASVVTLNQTNAQIA
jgi:hypothetical protein